MISIHWQIIPADKFQISLYALELYTFQWGVVKYFFKRFFCYGFPFFCSEIKYFRDWCKCNFRCWFTETIPGTYILANITTKHPVLKFILHFIWYQHVLKLDGEITDTTTSI